MALGGDTDGRSDDPRERAVSEFTGVAVLVAITLLVTGSVGLYVLVDSGSENTGPNANFTYQYLSEASALIVTHERGDTFAAGNLTFRSERASATWAELANTDNSTVVGPGATVQLSRRNAYGEPVYEGTQIRIVYAPPTGNETVLDSYSSE